MNTVQNVTHNTLIPDLEVKKTTTERAVFNCLGGMLIGGFTSYLTVYLHELGHSIAMRMLFHDVNPGISVNLLGEGSCEWGGNAENPTKIGLLFSPTTRLGLVNAAGPMVDILNITTSLFVAQKLRLQKADLYVTSCTMNALVLSMGMFNYINSCEEGWLDGDYGRIHDHFSIGYGTMKGVAGSVGLICAHMLALQVIENLSDSISARTAKIYNSIVNGYFIFWQTFHQASLIDENPPPPTVSLLLGVSTLAFAVRLLRK